ncbi:MAG TPA: tetratricopeptide repeat protein, partial [Chthoniobacterales bacterium]|nr:tetratricopeptide repeat protein [Chthoniobacterales bacterium]
FFDELKRRKVYRVAVAYVIAAGGIIQLASAVFPAWELPNWSLRLVIVLLLVGFPIALILAWAFDITSTGIQTTPALPAAGDPTNPHRRRNVFLLGAVGLTVAIVAGFFLLPHVAAKKVDKSIAVLPFENFSDDKSNAYFADGIQDDILTTLSRISDLKVISRTSVMGYRGSTRNVREIGKALGAGAILEGSVRSDGKRVRVNVQLINTENDEHLWANEYDRELTDVFAIQTDLAHEIAGALQARLSPTEEARVSQKPTENGEAYLAFVEAHDLQMRPDHLETDIQKAEELYERAIQLDPKFALAFAELSCLQSWIYHTSDPTSARQEKARVAAEEAQRLQPNLPETHAALGYYYYWTQRDYERALGEFAAAQHGLPNDAENLKAIAAIQRRQGKWNESTANFEKAVSLNPKDADLLLNLAFNYIALRRYDEADRTVDRGLQAAPDSFSLRGVKAQIALTGRGDFSVAESLLANAPDGFDPDGLISFVRANVWIMQRKFTAALQVLQNCPGEILHSMGTAPVPKSFSEGMIYLYMHENEKARAAFQRARPMVERLIRESPDDASRHLLLAQLLVGIGDKQGGIAEADRAAQLLPESRDAFDGPQVTIGQAQVLAWAGENERALELIKRSLSTPNGTTVPLLKIDPGWDPIRSDPRFQQLIATTGRSPDEHD